MSLLAKKRNGKKLGVFPVGTVVQQGTSSETLIGVAKGMKEILDDMGLYRLVGETKPPPLECQRYTIVYYIDRLSGFRFCFRGYKAGVPTMLHLIFFCQLFEVRCRAPFLA